MSNREAMLARIRQATRDGNTSGTPPLPERGAVGRQGAGPDPIGRLRDELTAAGGVFHPVATWAEARVRVLDLLTERSCRRVLVGPGVEGVAGDLAAAGLQVCDTASMPTRADQLAADAGVSAVDAVVAETGTIALRTRPGQPRALSLFPPVHIALADPSKIVEDLFDLFTVGDPPACLSLITGPSKTGDIELKLVTGVHGPGEVHLVFVAG